MNQLLAQIGALQAQPNTNNGALARQILLGASLEDPSKINMGKSANEGAGGPSVVSRIFDMLSRPNYAVANAVSTQIKNANTVNKNGFQLSDLLKGITSVPETLGSIVEGLEGSSKKTFSDVLGESGMEPGVGRAAAGLVLDIALDPTTYIGAGAVKGAAKAAGKVFVKGGEVAGKDIAESVAKISPDASIGLKTNVPEEEFRPGAVKPSNTKTVPPWGAPQAQEFRLFRVISNMIRLLLQTCLSNYKSLLPEVYLV